ncbi:hypothetical protein BDW22DRAFT_1109899 [Trametopsis cervina]|nr:hypothetical protein BDW22DRAFT_1109899 [Trametopsis cervina]
MLTFTDLPADIVDHILAAMPDFKSLAAMISVSKQYTYAVFREHKRAIISSVALNIVGPSSLPQALQLASIRARPRLGYGYDDSWAFASDALVSLPDTMYNNLSVNARPIKGLENFYSQMYKDRRSKESVLTADESLRFRRAMYRVWWLIIVTTILPEDPFARIGFYLSPEDRFHPMMAVLKPSDLREIMAVMSFTNEFMCGLVGVQPDTARDSQEYVMSPLLAWSLYEDPRTLTDRYFNRGNTPDIIASVRKTAEAQKANADDIVAAPASSLLDEIHGADDKCSRCDTVIGMGLYGPENWELLSWRIEQMLISSLPGNLARNMNETRAISLYIHQNWTTKLDWQVIPEEILSTVVVGEQELWDKDKWYCADCLTALLRPRFRRWWQSKRQERMYFKRETGTTFVASLLLFLPYLEGTLQTEDCWYGYNCRTQLHSSQHASRLNVGFQSVSSSRLALLILILEQHLCEPVRDDGRTPAEAWGPLDAYV